MTGSLVICIFLIVHGFLGAVFAIQYNVPRRYKNTQYEKPYKRFMGIAQLIMGLPCFAVFMLTRNNIISMGTAAVLFVVFAIPAIIYAIVGDMRFRKRLGK